MLLSAYTTRTTLQHERARAAEERLWQKRADLYVDLIKWSSGALQEIHARVLSGEFGAMPRPVPMVVSGSLGARAAVFLSQPVLKELDQVRRCLSDYAGRPLADLGHSVDVSDPYAERFFRASQKMTATIRDELQQGRLAANPPPAHEAGLAYG